MRHTSRDFLRHANGSTAYLLMAAFDVMEIAMAAGYYTVTVPKL